MPSRRDIAELLTSSFDAMVDPVTLERHREAVAEVERWQAASPGSRLHYQEPFDRELSGRPVRLLAERPSDATKPFEEYGFDSSGKLRIARLPILDDDDALECLREESLLELPLGSFVYAREWRRGRLAESAFGATLLVTEGERVTLKLDLGPPSDIFATVTEYRWEGGRPVGARSEEWRRSELSSWSLEPGFSTLVRAEYEGDALARLYGVESNRETILWSRAKGPGESHEGALRRWKRALLRAVPDLVSRTEGRPQAVAFLYPAEDPYLGEIVVYRVPQADIARVAGSPEALAYWNPAEAIAQNKATVISQDLDAELQDIRAHIRRARQEPPSASHQKAERDVLTAVAKALNNPAKWNGSALGETFVVWPAELELQGLENALGDAIPRSAQRRVLDIGRSISR